MNVRKEVKPKKTLTYRNLKSIDIKELTRDIIGSLDDFEGDVKQLVDKLLTTKIKEKIDDCQKDTKKLYKLVVYLTGTATENLLPPRKTDNQLAKDFAKFFMNKIQTIGDNLSKHPL